MFRTDWAAIAGCDRQPNLGEILHHEGILLRVFDTCLWTRMREFDGRTRSPGGDRGRSDSGQDAKKMAAISHDQD